MVFGRSDTSFRLKATWVRTFMISTFAMVVSYVVFLFGFSSYSFIDNKESIVFEREASIEEAQNQENNIVKQERGKEPCQAPGSLSLRLDKILAGGGAGSTFFFEQLSNLDNPFTGSNPEVEIQRMKNLWRVGVGDHTVKPVAMTIFWLLPQFFLLGLMEGLVGGGLTDLIVPA
ncbi:PREDICTED: NRT1/ PTR FAMILY 5, partial [Prunus dulcis]